MDRTTIVPLNTTTSHCIHGSLTGSLGIIVQASLAAIAFSALIGSFRYFDTYSSFRHSTIHLETLTPHS